MCLDRVSYLSSHPPGDERPTTVFDATLSPNLEKGQYTPPIKSLAADAFTFVMAGTETSSNVLITTIFKVLDGEPRMLERLKGELREAIPDTNTIVAWAVLENLPYLVMSHIVVNLDDRIINRIIYSVPSSRKAFVSATVFLVASLALFPRMAPSFAARIFQPV